VVNAKEDDSSSKLKTAVDNLLNTKYLSTAREVSYNYSINYGTSGEKKYSGSKMIFASGENISKDTNTSEKLIVECKKTQNGVNSNYRLYVDPSDKNNYKIKFMGKEKWENISSRDSKIVNFGEDYEGYSDNSNLSVLNDIKYEYRMIPHGAVRSFKDKQNNTHVIMVINTGKLPENVIFYGLFSGCEIQDEFIISDKGQLIEFISDRHMGNMLDSTPREDGKLKIKVLFNYERVDLSNTANLDNLFNSYIGKSKEIVAKKGFAGLEQIYNAQTPVLSTKTAATVKPVLATPTKLKAARVSSSSIKLTWSGVKGASGYQLYRRI
jgi:ubiquitin